MDIVTDGATLTLSGDFDVRSTREVRNAIYDAIQGLDRDLVIDLSGVDTVDLTALRVLAVATREVNKSGHHLTLRGCGPSVRRMLHLSRLRRAVEVEAAAATAGRPYGSGSVADHTRASGYLAVATRLP